MATTTDTVIDFGQGLPDLDLVPVSDLRRCYDAVVDEGGGRTFAYYGEGGTREMRVGNLELRRWVAGFISRRDGVDLSPDDVMLVHGSTDGLANAAEALCKPGDGAIVEEATFHHMTRFLKEAGGAVTPVPLDATGMDVDALDAALDNHVTAGNPPSAIYTIPSFQSPTGTLLPLERRRRLLDAANRHGAVVVEDVCYHDLWYDAPPATSLLGLDRHSSVIQSGTFSKLIAPGLRLGWLAGPRELIDRVAAVRRDFSVDRVGALAVARYCEEGLLEPHIELLRVAYKAKRDAAVEGLAQHCAKWATYNIPTGGFYIWLQLTPSIDVANLRQLATDRGLGLRTGEIFGGGTYNIPALRLSVSQVPYDHIAPGLAILGEVLAAAATLDAGEASR